MSQQIDHPSCHVSLEEWVERFEWDSEEQQKGFLSFIKDLRSRPQIQASDRPVDEHLEEKMMTLLAWLIQKDLEAQQWFSDRIGDLDKRHIDTQKMLLDRIEALEAKLGIAPVGSEEGEV